MKPRWPGAGTLRPALRTGGQPGAMIAMLFLLGMVVLGVPWATSQAEVTNLLGNPTFIGAEEQIPPPGWSMYGSLANGHQISVVNADDPERRALLLEDNVDIPRGNEGEIGLQQTISGGPGRYLATVRIGAVDGVTPDVTAFQVRFLPSNEYVQIRLTPQDTEGFDEFSVDAVAPEGTTHVRIYLYTWAARTPKVRVHSVTLRHITLEEVEERLSQGIIRGFEPLTFDLSTASIESPPLSELRARVPEGRPRLFARPESLDELRNKRFVSPIANLVWRNIQIRAISMQIGALPPYPPDARPSGMLDITAWRRGIEIANDVLHRLDTLSFHYLLTGDTDSGEAAKKLLLHVAAWDPYGNSGRQKNDEISMRLLYSMSRAYDWLHPLLLESDRTVVQQAMRERGNDVYLTMRQTRFEESLLDNHLTRSLGFLGQAAIAFMGDFPEAEVWFDYVISLFLVKYPPWGGDEGGWSQGVSYWQSYINWVLEFVDALEIATGLNLYDKPFFQNTGYFKLYAHPPKSRFGAFGDHSDSPPDAGSTRVMSRLALEYKDPALQWYVDQISGMRNVPDIPMNTFLGYIWAPLPEDLPPRPELPQDFPQSRLFSDVGWALMNVDMSDWQNNVHVKFKSSPYGSYNHSHAEQNSFQIEAYGSPLAIPSGYYPWYGSPHHAEWTWQSRSKNTILIDGRGQGVQSLDAKGEILKVSFGPQFDYVLGDATQAYMGHLERFWRHLLFVKPNLIIIYDQLESEMEEASYDWLLHSLKAMQVDAAANKVLVEGDTAHMWVDFITPQSLAFHVTDQFPIPPEERDAYKPNQWHLTATTESVDGTARFLTVLVPRPNSQANDKPPNTTAIDAGGGHGVALSMDGIAYMVGFRDVVEGPLEMRGFETDGTAMVWWEVDEAQPTRSQGVMALGATRVTREGSEVVRSANTVDIGVHWERDETELDSLQISIQLSGATEWLVLQTPIRPERVELNGEAFHGWEYQDGVLTLRP